MIRWIAWLGLRMRSERLDDVERIILFALGILVLDKAVGITHAGDVDARRRIAMGGKPDVHLIIADARAVAPAIGNVFEDCRNGLRPVPRQEEPCCKPASILHRNPRKLPDFHPFVQFFRRHAPFAIFEIPKPRVALN